MTQDKIDYTKLKHLVVTVGSEKDYCLPGPVPTCLEWVYCFQARHVSKLRNYPATDQHDKVRVRQVRAAAEVRGRGMVDCSSQRQLWGRHWLGRRAPALALTCVVNHWHIWACSSQAASRACVKGKNLVDDEGGELHKCSLLRDRKDMKCSKWTSVQCVWRVVKGSHVVHCIKSGKYQGNHWVLRKEWLRTDHLQIGEIVSKWTNDTSKCKFSEITH